MASRVDLGPPVTPLIDRLPAMVPFIAPEALERKLGRPLRLRLGANESAFGISPRARQAIQEQIDHATWYGDPESFELRDALAEVHTVKIENLVVGSGIDDLLGLVVRTFLEPGNVAITSLGAYPTFNYHVLGYGGVLEQVPYLSMRNDVERIATAAHVSRARLVYIANPDNPTGSWCSADELQFLLQRLSPSCVLILDEAYSEFAPAEAVPPCNADDPRLIRLRTFSKAHGLAGLRIGYGIGSAAIVAAFDKIRLHFGVNRLAQAAALASLADREFIRQVVASVEHGRRGYEQLARTLDLLPMPSATNFVAIDMGSPALAAETVNGLLEQSVFVRMPKVAPLNRCIRLSVGTDPQQAHLAHVLRDVVRKARETV